VVSWERHNYPYGLYYRQSVASAHRRSRFPPRGVPCEIGGIAAPSPVDARSCDGCTLCCKVLGIDALDKPRGSWCAHAEIGRGCRIYAERPEECATFSCGWLDWAEAGEHWYPARSKMVIASELGGRRIAVHVDPGRPAAWRDAPFYDDLKGWARAGGAERQVVVNVGARAIVILPDRDVDLGVVEPGETIVTGEAVDTQGRRRLNVAKMRADDPMLARGRR
jgi:hypothetical protein